VQFGDGAPPRLDRAVAVEHPVAVVVLTAHAGVDEAHLEVLAPAQIARLPLPWGRLVTSECLLEHCVARNTQLPEKAVFKMA